MPERKAKPAGTRHRKKKKLAAILISIIILTGGAVAAWAFLLPLMSGGRGSTPSTTTVQYGNLTIGVTASGTTVLGSVSQPIDRILSDLGLEVEKVLVTAGDSVTQGQALLKITDDSLSAARSSLEATLHAAQMSLSQEEIDHESSLVDAQAERLANLALSDTAKSQYQAALDGLRDTVESARKDLDAAKTISTEYPDQINSAETNLTALQVQLSAADTALIQAQNNLIQKQNAYQAANESWLSAKAAADQVTAFAVFAQVYADQNSSTLSPSGEYAVFLVELAANCQAANAALAAQEPSYQAAAAALSQAQHAVRSCEAVKSGLEQQISDLEENIATWKQELTQARSSLAACQIKYNQAVNREKTQTLDEENAYQENLLLTKNAEALYAIRVQALEKTLTNARSAFSQAEDDLAAFAAATADGSIHAGYAGTVSSINYKAEDVLSAVTAIATFTDAKLLTLTVTIDQADIAGIAVGNEVPVTFSANSRKAYAGIVTAIETTSGATSVSDVNYAVTVRIDGDLTGLTSGLTAAVSFVKDTLTDVLYLPESAVHTGSSGTYVRKMENGQSIDTPVVTGQSNGTYIVIANGLKKGDLCVLTSTDLES